MFVIKCPYCGERDQTEFSCHGESHIARPENPNDVSDKEWGEYLFFRSNPKGMHYERWTHDHGCRQWFNVQRHTVTDKIIQTYKMGEVKPEDNNA
jgi:heterotetrameric sarcosine oxidase delta subunit